MKKWYGGVLTTSFLMLFVLGYYVIKNPVNESYFTSPLNFTGTNPLEWINAGAPPALPNPENTSQVISADAIVADFFAQRNLSKEEQSSLHTWNHLKYLVTHAQGLPNAVEAIKEAGVAWKNLITSVEQEKLQMDELDQCNELLGKENNQTVKANRHGNGSTTISMVHDGKPRKYFPFKQNDLFVATLRVGSEGIQMTVDGKHITSFAFRETLEPWLVSEVRIAGDINLISVVASGLPTSEDLEHIIDLETLKAVPIPPRRQLDLFLVFSPPTISSVEWQSEDPGCSILKYDPDKLQSVSLLVW
ncbi:hypothetical protein DH2020_003329 [Rehmannia glutinosa]|uniref:Galectin n=1 Tax=Rehmannia glutinosa TaxID=99300 RepID=A0ABR0XLA2_REHGL